MALDEKTFVFDDVCKHNKANDCWVIIFGKVYDVTSFMYDHPGGDKALLEGTGKDATDAFEDFGHSDDAREMMDKYYVGMIGKSTIPVKPRYTLTPTDDFYKSDKTLQFIVKIIQFLLPLFVILGMVFTVRA